MNEAKCLDQVGKCDPETIKAVGWTPPPPHAVMAPSSSLQLYTVYWLRRHRSSNRVGALSSFSTLSIRERYTQRGLAVSRVHPPSPPVPKPSRVRTNDCICFFSFYVVVADVCDDGEALPSSPQPPVLVMTPHTPRMVHFTGGSSERSSITKARFATPRLADV